MGHVRDTDKEPLCTGDSFEQIGSTLKHARRLQGLKISNVSAHLRISGDYLSKLESGAFEKLPAPAYVKGFLRSYGQFVALDPSSLVARYTALTANAAAMPTCKTPMSPQPPQRSAPAIASMLVFFAGLSYGGWYWVNGGDVNDQMVMVPSKIVAAPSVPAAMQDTLIDHSAGSAVLVVGQVQSQKLTKPTQAKKIIAAEPITPTSSVEKTILAATKKTLITKTPTAVAPTKTVEILAAINAPREPATPPTAANSPVLSGDLAETQVITRASQSGETHAAGNSAIANLRDPAQEITIRAIAASWVEIVRDNGEEVMAKLMQAGDSYVVEGNTRLYLSTGNAGGLQVVVGNDDARSIGEIGQIVRDLPLVTDKLRQTF